MTNFFKNFRKSEDGAVTVDFVVLTAAIVLLGLAVGSSIGTGVTNLGNDIAGDLATVQAMESATLAGGSAAATPDAGTTN